MNPEVSDVRVLVDGDACPVKAETYRVAERYGLRVVVVSNSVIALPREAWIERVIVSDALDAADDWIAEAAGPRDIVVTADVPLASRCIKAGAKVVMPSGRTITEASIGMTLATRNLMTDLRSAGATTSGPKPFSARERSAFLSALDLAATRLLRERPAP